MSASIPTDLYEHLEDAISPRGFLGRQGIDTKKGAIVRALRVLLERGGPGS